MTEAIRTKIREEMRQRGLTVTGLAKQIDIEREALHLILAGKRAKLPPSWRKILEVLGLELELKNVNP